MKKASILSILLFSILTTVLYADAPAWFIPLRDAIIAQELSSSEILPIYTAAKTQAEAITSEFDRFIMLARIENLMGQVYQREGRDTEAIAYYERGESFAQSALNLQRASEAYYILSESIALLLSSRGFLYQVANGMRFTNSVNRAIALDPDNFEAKYLLASSYAYSPLPFRNLRRAATLLEEIIDNARSLSPDLRFNVYYTMGIVRQKQRRPAEARTWFERALALYPTNKDVQNSLGEL